MQLDYIISVQPASYTACTTNQSFMRKHALHTEDREMGWGYPLHLAIDGNVPCGRSLSEAELTDLDFLLIVEQGKPNWRNNKWERNKNRVVETHAQPKS